MKCPRCGTKINEHPAELCLDAVFAELVMGWEQKPFAGYSEAFFWYDPKEEMHKIEVWRYYPSTNVAHAMQGVEKYANDDHVLELMWVPRYIPEQKPFWHFMIRENTKPTEHERDREEPTKQIGALADTKELAITRALILWAGEKGKK